MSSVVELGIFFVLAWFGTGLTVLIWSLFWILCLSGEQEFDEAVTDLEFLVKGVLEWPYLLYIVWVSYRYRKLMDSYDVSRDT